MMSVQTKQGQVRFLPWGSYCVYTSFRIVSLNKNGVISNEPVGDCGPEVRRNLAKADIIRPCKASKISPRPPLFPYASSFEMTPFLFSEKVCTYSSWGRGGRGLINDAYQIARRNPSLPSRNPSHPSRWEGITFGFSTSFLITIMFLALGCSSNKTNSNQVKINLTPDKHALNITGLDPLIVQDINRDSLGGNWQSLVPVYKMPADTDMKNYQPIQPGKYQVKDSIVVFTPDTPFMARQIYFVRYYKFNTNTKAADYIMGRNKLRDLPYTDLIFKQ